jgi:ribosomal protein S18 acetylase RimI-like enzyme
MGALARQAHAEGATAGYLQVEADNAGARELYDRLGFTDHSGYHYRRRAA